MRPSVARDSGEGWRDGGLGSGGHGRSAPRMLRGWGGAPWEVVAGWAAAGLLPILSVSAGAGQRDPEERRANVGSGGAAGGSPIGVVRGAAVATCVS